MSLRFDEFRPIYPPRPELNINPATLGRYRGFIAQYKYNDFRALLYILPDGSISLLNRYRQLMRYVMSDAMKKAIQAIRVKPGYFYVFDGGLMIRAGKVRDRLILWDILVHENEYLVGTTYRDRYRLLFQIMGEPNRFERETGHKVALQVNRYVWIAHSFTDQFEERYRSAIVLDEIEGLVLKNPAGRLEQGIFEHNNGSWMIRVRKPSALYTF